jgi:hypothetical protein
MQLPGRCAGRQAGRLCNRACDADVPPKRCTCIHTRQTPGRQHAACAHVASAVLASLGHGAQPHPALLPHTRACTAHMRDCNKVAHGAGLRVTACAGSAACPALCFARGCGGWHLEPSLGALNQCGVLDSMMLLRLTRCTQALSRPVSRESSHLSESQLHRWQSAASHAAAKWGCLGVGWRLIGSLGGVCSPRISSGVQTQLCIWQASRRPPYQRPYAARRRCSTRLVCAQRNRHCAQRVRQCPGIPAQLGTQPATAPLQRSPPAVAAAATRRVRAPTRSMASPAADDAKAVVEKRDDKEDKPTAQAVDAEKKVRPVRGRGGLEIAAAGDVAAVMRGGRRAVCPSRSRPRSACKCRCRRPPSHRR